MSGEGEDIAADVDVDVEENENGDQPALDAEGNTVEDAPVIMDKKTRLGIEKGQRMASTSCRYYEQEYPEVGDNVVVIVRNIAEMGAYVSLLEYNGIEGMILLSELSRKRFRSINALIRVGKTEVANVMRVDKEKGYIDLSKRKVEPEDKVYAEERWKKNRAVFSIMRAVCESSGVDILKLYETIAWPLNKKPFKSTHEAFKLAVTDPDKVFEKIQMEDNVKEALLKTIRKKMTPQPVKVRADVEVTCFKYEGIDAIREALVAGESSSNEDVPVTIKLIAPPLYVMHAVSIGKKPGLEALDKAIAIVDKIISEKGGNLKIKVAPHATSIQEENKLASMMEQMREQGEFDEEEDEEE